MLYDTCCDWYRNCAIRTAVCMFFIGLKHWSFISRVIAYLFSHLIYNSIFWNTSHASPSHVHNKVFFPLHSMYVFTRLQMDFNKMKYFASNKPDRNSACMNHAIKLTRDVVPRYWSRAWVLKSYEEIHADKLVPRHYCFEWENFNFYSGQCGIRRRYWYDFLEFHSSTSKMDSEFNN